MLQSQLKVNKNDQYDDDQYDTIMITSSDHDSC